MLREPANHYGGYVWTYAKGRPDKGDTPEQTALREVREETGYEAEVVDVLPGVFKGGTTTNAFFVMRHIGPPRRADWETASVRRYDSLALDFPATHAIMPQNMMFGSQGADSIRMGCLPVDPEHKWFHWFNGNVLSMHRRGTGFCLYQVQFQSDGGGLRATHALVIRESGQGSGMSEDEDRDIISLLLLELAALEH